MQWAFFRIPVTGGDEAIELNRFLRSVRVLNIHREFVGQGDGSYWAMSVEYLPAAESASRSGRDAGMSAAKVDFKTLLPPEDFVLFAKLREWRKQAAFKEATPVYTIFTNEQLAEIARRRCATLAALGEIDGIGPARLEKYGRQVLDFMGGIADVAGTGAVSGDS